MAHIAIVIIILATLLGFTAIARARRPHPPGCQCVNCHPKGCRCGQHGWWR